MNKFVNFICLVIFVFMKNVSNVPTVIFAGGMIMNTDGYDREYRA
jgi:hypothetical protein